MSSSDHREAHLAALRDLYLWAREYGKHYLDVAYPERDGRYGRTQLAALLKRAEAALSRCASAAGNCHPADGCRSVLAIHRDYFAEKGDDRG